MFVLGNFPAEFLKQKAVPGSFIMKGKEAFRGGMPMFTHTETFQIQFKSSDLPDT